MTLREAIKYIVDVLSSGCNYGKTLDYQLTSCDFERLDRDIERGEDACRVVCAALEKQIPKKPLKQECDFFDFNLVCPECKNRIVNVWSKREYKPNYCHYCGQALDWGVENES